MRFLYTSNVAKPCSVAIATNNDPYCRVQAETVSVTALVMRSYHCHGNRFVGCGVVSVLLYLTTASDTIN